MKNLNSYTIGTEAVSEGINLYGVPMDLDKEDVFPVLDYITESGSPRIVAGVVTHEGLGVKSFELVTRKDGKKYWYAKQYLTSPEVTAIASSPVFQALIDRTEERANAGNLKAQAKAEAKAEAEAKKAEEKAAKAKEREEAKAQAEAEKAARKAEREKEREQKAEAKAHSPKSGKVKSLLDKARTDSDESEIDDLLHNTGL